MNNKSKTGIAPCCYNISEHGQFLLHTKVRPSRQNYDARDNVEENCLLHGKILLHMISKKKSRGAKLLLFWVIFW